LRGVILKIDLLGAVSKNFGVESAKTIKSWRANRGPVPPAYGIEAPEFEGIRASRPDRGASLTFRITALNELRRSVSARFKARA
jgi:hypothetical protein